MRVKEWVAGFHLVSGREEYGDKEKPVVLKVPSLISSSFCVEGEKVGRGSDAVQCSRGGDT